MMRASPQLASQPSPINTPACFQHDLDWVHATPSPSPMLRNPQPDAELLFAGPAPTTPGAVVPLELLRTWCSPFFESMLQELQRRISDQIVERLQAGGVFAGLGAMDGLTRAKASSSSSSPTLDDGNSPDAPFSTLFGGDPAAASRRQVKTARNLRREQPPLREETAREKGLDACSVASSSRSSPIVGSKAPGVPTGNSAQLISEHSSMLGDEPKPFSGLFTAGTKGCTPPQTQAGRKPHEAQLMSEHSGMLGDEPKPFSGLFSAGTKGGTPPQTQAGRSPHEAMPCYLFPQAPQEQPKLHRWQDQNPAPMHSPVESSCVSSHPSSSSPQFVVSSSMTAPSAMVPRRSSAGSTAPAIDRPLGLTTPALAAPAIPGVVASPAPGAVAPAPAPHEQEKSVMVCRHWKSKGFCKLEDQCKFLHPENKRGNGSRKGTGGSAGVASTGSAQLGAGNAPGFGHSQSGGSKRASRRQSGERHDTGGGDGGPP